VADKRPLKYRIHAILAADPDLLWTLEQQAIGYPREPTDALKLAFGEGKRVLAAEWLSMYREVEHERKQS